MKNKITTVIMMTAALLFAGAGAAEASMAMPSDIESQLVAERHHGGGRGGHGGHRGHAGPRGHYGHHAHHHAPRGHHGPHHVHPRGCHGPRYYYGCPPGYYYGYGYPGAYGYYVGPRWGISVSW